MINDPPGSEAGPLESPTPNEGIPARGRRPKALRLRPQPPLDAYYTGHCQLGATHAFLPLVRGSTVPISGSEIAFTTQGVQE